MTGTNDHDPGGPERTSMPREDLVSVIRSPTFLPRPAPEGRITGNISNDSPKSSIAQVLGIIPNRSARIARPRPSLITYPDYLRRNDQPSLATPAVAQLTASRDSCVAEAEGQGSRNPGGCSVDGIPAESSEPTTPPASRKTATPAASNAPTTPSSGFGADGCTVPGRPRDAASGNEGA